MTRRAVARARALRRDTTDAEKHLWRILRSRQLAGWKFRRQRPIGRYVADFVCMEQKVIVEVDGSQHADNLRDAIRTVWLQSMGYQVIRFWNPDVLTNAEGVAETILDALKRRSGTLTPALSRGAGEGELR
jgi:very-short-patch-repair endonuclease